MMLEVIVWAGGADLNTKNEIQKKEKIGSMALRSVCAEKHENRD